MEDNQMVPATGPTPTTVTKAATNHLARDVDLAILKQRESDALMAIVVTLIGVLGTASLVVLGAYILGGAQ